MATPQREQSKWWGGISSLSSGLFASATKRRDGEQEHLLQPVQRPKAPAVEPISQATPRPRVTFQEGRDPSPPVSPVLRASAAQLANRKIFDRPQGPSSKLSASTIRATNFSPAPSTTRPMFRASVGPDAGRFSFSSRVNSVPARNSNATSIHSHTLRNAPGALRDAFSIGTPRRDMNDQSAAKTQNRDLFPMKIPEPPAHLTGEAIASRVPNNPNRVGSIYADEFLADLCPKDFTEVQRKQFFCILDLRRLKYASNDIFLQKDWGMNILNFAKEYEKARSMIMLRYGLYEFKSIKPSQEAVSQWKAANGIPDDESDRLQPSTSSRPNGTEGILARSAAKRKAQDDLPQVQEQRNALSQNKRARGAERGPLTETATPTLNKGNKKRAAYEVDDMEENPSAKVQRPPPSATKKFFEQVANSKPTQPVPPETSGQGHFGLGSVSKPKSSTASNLFGAPQISGTSSSILGGGAKSTPNKFGTASGNIFGHLSDTGSGQASGNENDAGDEDDSEEEESEAQEVSQSDDHSVAASGGLATPQPAGGLFVGKKQTSAFASATSSETGEAAARGSGPSIFDRITTGEDGKPKRLLPHDDTGASPAASVGFSENEKPSSSLAPAPTTVDKTWSPDTPIKFASSKPSSMFPSSTPKQAPQSATPAPLGFNFMSPKPSAESQPFGAPKAPTSSLSSGTTPSMFSTSVNGTTGPLFGQAKKDDPKASVGAATPSAAETPGSDSASGKKEGTQPASSLKFGSAPDQTSAPTFGFGSGQPTPTLDLGSSTSKPLFGSASSGNAPPPTFGIGTAAGASQPKKSLFGAASGSDSSQPKPQFALSSNADSGKPTLFGSAAGSESSESKKPLFGQASGSQATQQPPSFGATTAADASKPATAFAFGSTTPAPASSQPKSTFSFGVGSESKSSESKALFGSGSESKQSEPKPLFGSGSGMATTSFGATTPQIASETPKATTTGSSLFNFTSSTPTPAGAQDQGASTSKPLFGPSSGAAAQPPALFGAGQTGQPPAPKSQSVLFGSASTTPSSSFDFTAGANGGNPTPSFTFGAAGNSSANVPQTTTAPTFSGGNGGGSSFTFSAGGNGGQSFNNPFATGASSAPPASVSFGSQTGGSSGGAPAGMFSFSSGGAGVADKPAAEKPAPMFSFGGAAQTNGAAATNQPSLFNLAPPMGGTSTGTNTPFTFGGASSLATTPANGTPEPGPPERGEAEATQADGDEEKQEQINLTEGGPGEEDEDVVFEVRAKALKLCPDDDSSEDESPAAAKSVKKSPWKTMGIGPFRLLKHKTSGAVRALLRGEPRGNVVVNKSILPSFSYKTEKGDKYVKLTTMSDDGKKMETWMLQVKDADKGKSLANALEKFKVFNSAPKKE